MADQDQRAHGGGQSGHGEQQGQAGGDERAEGDHDVTEALAGTPPRPATAPARVDADAVARLAKRLRGGSPAVLLLGAGALTEHGQRAAERIAAVTGATLYSETFPATAERGGGLPDLDRLPYFPEAAIQALAGAGTVILAGAVEPVSYFGYEGIPGLLAPPGSVEVLAAPGDNAVQALEDLADALGAPVATHGRAATPDGTHLPKGPLTPGTIGRIVSALLPEQAIVSVEGGTCGYPFFTASVNALRHTTLTNTGGAIGQGLPAALGAAIAAPERQVVALQSDGSAQYTIQALWTMAREQTSVVTLIASNRKYNILQTELTRHGASVAGPASTALTSLDDPALDWMGLPVATASRPHGRRRATNWPARCGGHWPTAAPGSSRWSCERNPRARHRSAPQHPEPI